MNGEKMLIDQKTQNIQDPVDKSINNNNNTGNKINQKINVGLAGNVAIPSVLLVLNTSGSKS